MMLMVQVSPVASTVPIESQVHSVLEKLNSAFRLGCRFLARFNYQQKAESCLLANYDLAFQPHKEALFVWSQASPLFGSSFLRFAGNLFFFSSYQSPRCNESRGLSVSKTCQ